MSDHEHSEEHKESHGGGGGHGGGHGGGGGHEEAHEGAPEWLISFADNVALMMGFFVILLAMNLGPKGSSVNNTGEPGTSTDQAAREADFVIGMRDAFNNKIDPLGENPSEAWLRKRLEEKQGGLATENGPNGSHPNLQAIRKSDYNRPTASIAFDDRSSVLNVSGRELIRDTADKLKGQRWIIEVRGHVSPFESMRNVRAAMQLSHERAMSVASALAEVGLHWENIRIVACGDSDRLIARTYDREQDRTNQRVEIVETAEQVSPDPYAGEDGPESKVPEPLSPDGTPMSGHR